MALKLNDSSFKLYHKPDDIIQYINKESNHLPNVTEQLSRFIGKRFSNHSSDEKMFKESADSFKENRLYKNLVHYSTSASNQEDNNKNCHSNIIWFNSLDSKTATANDT